MNNNNPSSDASVAPDCDALVSRWIRPEVRAINAYHVPNPGQLIKLDAMENPYSWPDALREKWLALIKSAAINRYPDPGAGALKSALRKSLALPGDYSILLGNGSDELIQMIAMAVAAPERVVMAPEPSFVMYQMIALMVGMRYEGVKLTANFELDRDAMLAAINEYQPALVFLAYPNNPTGNLFDKNIIAEILRACEGLVVVDEAYFPFAGSTLMDWLHQYPNLLVMRTVSKMGLAGLRLGYLVGNEKWLQHIDKMRLPYNINVLTQLSAQFALENIDAFNAQTRQICEDRETLYQQLCEMEGLQVFPSQANFILFRVSGSSSQEVFEQLKQQGVLIKNLGNQPGLLKDCLRVTVGTLQENEQFLKALSGILND